MSQRTTVTEPAGDGVNDSEVVVAEPPKVRTPWWVVAVRWALILGVVTLALWVTQKLIVDGNAILVVLVAFVATCVVAVYATRRSIPAKYLVPGVLLLLGLQVWPLIFTISMSFTNYGYGHLGTKEEAIDVIQASRVFEVEGAQRYGLTVAVPDGEEPATAEMVFLLVDSAGTPLLGTSQGLEELSADDVTIDDTTGRISAADGYRPLTPAEVNDRGDLSEFGVPMEDGGISAARITEAFQGQSTIEYDEANDVIIDTSTDRRYIAQDGLFVPEDGEGGPLYPGWQENVGFDNYTRAFTDPVLRDGLIEVFLWNVAFAAISVGSAFVLGLALALLMNDRRLRGKRVYRSLLILPYALPIYVTALVWASMLNAEFGLFNDILGLDINWLGDPNLAKFSILLTNLWLGFPYWFIVCTGALQSIPNDVREAAAIDGASAFRTVRSVIMPLLLVAVGPLMIAAFAFNFNNFGLIFLMTEGGPFTGGQSQIGSTDLLITLAYRQAFGGAAPNYGFAAAISVIIFALVALISYFGFRRTRALEDVN